jgi:Nuclease-related domain
MKSSMSGREGEKAAWRAIEDHGFTVHNANILFYANCRNIDLVVFGKTKAIYVQVKSSTRPSSKNSVVVEGSTWTDEQLNGAPIYNKHDENLEAALIVIVDEQEKRPVTLGGSPAMHSEGWDGTFQPPQLICRGRAGFLSLNSFFANSATPAATRVPAHRGRRRPGAQRLTGTH